MRNFEDVQRDYHFSYSGADCRVYASEENGKVSSLRSLSTASVSVHEAKAPVRALGRRSVVGFTESIRTIAGSLVFVVVNDHPLAELKKNFNNRYNRNYSLDRKDGSPHKLSTMLNPIDLYFVYKTEISKRDSQGEMWVKGVRFINEGIVTSVNDMVTEVVIQFVAEDIVPFYEMTSQTLSAPERRAGEEDFFVESSVAGGEDSFVGPPVAGKGRQPALEPEKELSIQQVFKYLDERAGPPNLRTFENELQKQEEEYLRKISAQPGRVNFTPYKGSK
jgi:hypothetical protein